MGRPGPGFCSCMSSPGAMGLRMPVGIPGRPGAAGRLPPAPAGPALSRRMGLPTSSRGLGAGRPGAAGRAPPAWPGRIGAGVPERWGWAGRWLKGARPAGGAGRLLVPAGAPLTGRPTSWGLPGAGRLGSSGLRLGAGAADAGRAGGFDAITTGLGSGGLPAITGGLAAAAAGLPKGAAGLEAGAAGLGDGVIGLAGTAATGFAGAAGLATTMGGLAGAAGLATMSGLAGAAGFAGVAGLATTTGGLAGAAGLATMSGLAGAAGLATISGLAGVMGGLGELGAAGRAGAAGLSGAAAGMASAFFTDRIALLGAAPAGAPALG